MQKWCSGENVERCGIFANHDGMNKFSGVHNNGYRIIFEALVKHIVSSPALIRHRWEKDVETLDYERRLEAEDLLKPRLRYLPKAPAVCCYGCTYAKHISIHGSIMPDISAIVTTSH